MRGCFITSRVKGVFPVHMVFESDGAGLAGGIGRGWN